MEQKPDIVYPCWWTYAIIGWDEEDMRLAIGETVAGLKHRVNYARQSEQKKFVSLHVDVWVGTEEERNHIFSALQAHDKIRMVI